tara:strand:+ start:543 stop:1217 length:675 start_codon:yes stop_codon:yes gene_type:complete
MSKTEYNAVLFDLDGTLIDTAHDMIYALKEVINENNNDIRLSDEEMRNCVSDGSLGLIKLAFPSISTNTIKMLQNEFLDIYENNLCKKTTIFEPLDKLLNYLEIYNIKWGIVTNKPCRMTLKLLHKLNLDCSYVISGDTLSARKPNPKPLYIACELMSITSENAIYIGDASRDIKAGKDAKMTTITANYGYIKHNDDPNIWGADFNATSPSHLSTLVKNLLGEF